MDHMRAAREFFHSEGYAMETTGLVRESAEPGAAVCSLMVEPKHKNSAGVVMGGAIYTLADFTFAVASNVGQPLTVTLQGQITYLNPADCRRLIARTVCEKTGERACSYRVHIIDENQTEIASAHFIGCRIKSNEEAD